MLRTTNDMTGIALNRTSDEPSRISFKSMSTFVEPIARRAGIKAAVRFFGRETHEVGLLLVTTV